MKTLELFNSVISQPSSEKPLITKTGLIIEPDALWAKDRILKYYSGSRLDGYGLNKTFHKSWKKVFRSSRSQLMTDQLMHYISTYGTGFSDTVYIPGEVLEIPDQELVFKKIKAFSKEQMIEKCLEMLRSGMALKSETIDDILSVLSDDLTYQFTGEEKIRNKEAVIKLVDNFGVIPQNPEEFLRYLICKATGETLLIKSQEVIEAIKKSDYQPAELMEQYGVERLAEIFNRFKPLFLAFKPKCRSIINKISKLSKSYHKPLTRNPLNFVTTILLEPEDLHWLANASPYALFKALSACHNRMHGQYTFTYRIRNGKSYVKNNKVSGAVWANYYHIMNVLKERFDLSGKKFFVPNNVEFALPTSEKMYVGNIPAGSKFYGEALAVGIYWENAWGANDLDLSGINIGGKIGWNSSYKQSKGELMYSGDMTDASQGAVEYLYAAKGLKNPTLVENNVYSGNAHCKYKIVLGKGDHVDYNYMLNPDNLFLETKCQSVQRQTIIGMLLPSKKEQCFVILNFGAGETRVSGQSEVSKQATRALFQQWKNPLGFQTVVTELGGEFVNKKQLADYDFSLNNLEKDSFMRVFK